MTRSIRKGPFVDGKLLKKVRLNLLNKKKAIKTWSRKSVILPIMIGFTFLVHNGKRHIPVLISEDMIGYKLGQFSPTRIFKKHSSSKIKPKKK